MKAVLDSAVAAYTRASEELRRLGERRQASPPAVPLDAESGDYRQHRMGVPA